MGKREDGDFTIGGACDKGLFGVAWLLVQVVHLAAWLSDPFNRRK